MSKKIDMERYLQTSDDTLYSDTDRTKKMGAMHCSRHCCATRPLARHHYTILPHDANYCNLNPA